MWIHILQLAKIMELNVKIYTLQWNPIVHKPSIQKALCWKMLYSLLETKGSYMYVFYFSYMYILACFKISDVRLSKPTCKLNASKHICAYFSFHTSHTKIKALALVVSNMSQLYVLSVLCLQTECFVKWSIVKCNSGTSNHSTVNCRHRIHWLSDYT